MHAAGSDINARTWDRWIPIFEAIERSHIEAVQWLVPRGAKLHAKLRSGISVLDFAKYLGNEVTIRVIEEKLAR